MPCRAEYPHHVWAYDFVHDVCENGRKLKVLTVEDEFTPRCLAIEVEHRMPARLVARTLLKPFAEHGTPFVRAQRQRPGVRRRGLGTILGDRRHRRS